MFGERIVIPNSIKCFIGVITRHAEQKSATGMRLKGSRSNKQPLLFKPAQIFTVRFSVGFTDCFQRKPVSNNG